MRSKRRVEVGVAPRVVRPEEGATFFVAGELRLEYRHFVAGHDDLQADICGRAWYNMDHQ